MPDSSVGSGFDLKEGRKRVMEEEKEGGRELGKQWNIADRAR